MRFISVYTPRMALFAAVLALSACSSIPPLDRAGSTPLPSWNNGPAKQAIVDFVQAVTDAESPDFVPAAQRIAVFDNDGTLWSENPLYFQMYFVLDRVAALAPEHPEWRVEPLFEAALARDMHALGAFSEEELFELFAVTHGGMSSAEFEAIVSQWINQARHPQTGKAYTDMVFQPMLELLDYLRVNGFQTWIVSGGGINFMRPWSEAVYGIPPEQVIGTSFKTVYEERDGTWLIMREPELNHFNDEAGKPVGIERHIGRPPVFAAGNSDGDYPMLKYTTDPPGRQFGLIVHHTDAEREWAYDRQSLVGRLDRGLDDAAANGWVLVDMAEDWKVVYPE